MRNLSWCDFESVLNDIYLRTNVCEGYNRSLNTVFSLMDVHLLLIL